MKSNIVEFKATASRKVRGVDVKVGDPLFAVHYEREESDAHPSCFFVWCYTTKEAAQKIAAKFPNGPASETDRNANYRFRVNDLVPSAIASSLI